MYISENAGSIPDNANIYLKDDNMDEKIIKEIQSLKHEQVYIIPESDYGKAEIRYINEVYIVFEIPMYGGKPMFFNSS